MKAYWTTGRSLDKEPLLGSTKPSALGIDPTAASDAEPQTSPTTPCPKQNQPPDPNPTTGSATTKSTNSGKLTLSRNGQLHHIGIERTHAQSPVVLIIEDLNIKIIATQTGEIIRQLTLNPNRDHQPQNKETPEPEGSTVSNVTRHHIGVGGGLELTSPIGRLASFGGIPHPTKACS